MVKNDKVLLVEDNEGDIQLVKYCFKKLEIKHDLIVVKDGQEAINFLYKKENYSNAPTPDIIILDLNLPKKSGAEIIADIKNNEQLKHIPVLILSTTSTEQDILKLYQLHANSFMTKPVDMNNFLEMIRSIKNFWFDLVKLPQNI
jgi:CheY-like chemotaxis protein